MIAVIVLEIIRTLRLLLEHAMATKALSDLEQARIAADLAELQKFGKTSADTGG